MTKTAKAQQAFIDAVANLADVYAKLDPTMTEVQAWAAAKSFVQSAVDAKFGALK